MPTSPCLSLSRREKLDALRRLDPPGRWQSLAEERFCTRCGRTMTAAEIEVVGGTRAFGPLRLECPTETCLSTPADWVRLDFPPTGAAAQRPGARDISIHDGASRGTVRGKAARVLAPAERPTSKRSRRSARKQLLAFCQKMSDRCSRLLTPRYSAGHVFDPIA